MKNFELISCTLHWKIICKSLKLCVMTSLTVVGRGHHVMYTVSDKSNRQPIFPMHTPNIWNSLRLKNRVRQSMVHQIYAPKIGLLSPLLERWQCIAYNIISVQIWWHYLPWEGKNIFFLSMLWLWEITIQSDQYYREVKFVELWHTPPGCTIFLCTQLSVRSFRQLPPTHSSADPGACAQIYHGFYMFWWVGPVT